MSEIDWHAFYYGDLQSLYALWVVPIAFLAYRLVARPDPCRAEVPEAAGFVSVLTLVFAIETLIDPFATGPLLEIEAFSDGFAASLIPFVFVYLGDLRVLLLAIGVAQPECGWKKNLVWAARTTLIVPIAAGGLYALARLFWPDAPMKLLWILYELGFFLLAIYFGRIWVGHRLASEPARAGYLRAIFGYSAAYYALWLGADLLITIGGLDLGWAIRIVPNQLYYAFWTPFAYWLFFSGRSGNTER